MSALVQCCTHFAKYRHLRLRGIDLTLCHRVTVSSGDVSDRPLCPECSLAASKMVAPTREDHYLREIARRMSDTEEDTADLKKAAKRRGCSVAELVRTYVAWGLETDFEKEESRG